MEVRVNQSIPIERQWVTQAYLKLRKGGKAVGVDEETWKAFEKKLSSNLHSIWRDKNEVESQRKTERNARVFLQYETESVNK